jgi:hypothetical protein
VYGVGEKDDTPSTKAAYPQKNNSKKCELLPQVNQGSHPFSYSKTPPKKPKTRFSTAEKRVFGLFFQVLRLFFSIKMAVSGV